jgi:hypothetical protein
MRTRYHVVTTSSACTCPCRLKRASTQSTSGRPGPARHPTAPPHTIASHAKDNGFNRHETGPNLPRARHGASLAGMGLEQYQWHPRLKCGDTERADSVAAWYRPSCPRAQRQTWQSETTMHRLQINRACLISKSRVQGLRESSVLAEARDGISLLNVYRRHKRSICWPSSVLWKKRRRIRVCFVFRLSEEDRSRIQERQ